jgi:acetylornithine/N-succinyldiaminopimelate aminotransferase
MRTGEFFAFEKLGLADYVDVCTIAKTAQTGATFFTEEMNPKPGLIAGTFSGGSSSLLAGLEIMNLIEQEGYLGENGKIEQIHKQFIEMLNRLNETTCKGLLQEAGGLGLMVSVIPCDGSKEKVNALLQKLFNNGLIAFSCGRGPYKLRFLLPIVITKHDIEVAARIIEKSILEMN